MSQKQQNKKSGFDIKVPQAFIDRKIFCYESEFESKDFFLTSILFSTNFLYKTSRKPQSA
jgi:hypothetical protein